jgi:hypothetical protein
VCVREREKKREEIVKKVQSFPLTCRALEADYGNKFWSVWDEIIDMHLI